MDKYQLITIHSDGGSRGNPGPSAIGYLIHADGNLLHQQHKYIGVGTNNIAEYQALIHALAQLRKLSLSADQLTINLDSQLVVYQLIGKYKIKTPHIKELAESCQALLKQLKTTIDHTSINHIPRKQNSQADSLVNQALDAHVQ